MATQTERKTTTRAELLDAAAACLVERGLAGFTTVEVIERSGRSTGALYSHFPSKAELLEATVGHVIDRLLFSFIAALEELGPEERTVEGLLGLLWDQISDPRLGAVYEMYTAARTDPEIQAAIEPAIRQHLDALHTIMFEVLGDQFGVPNERVMSVANLVIFTMQGLALYLSAVPDPSLVDAMLHDLANLADWAFEQNDGVTTLWPSPLNGNAIPESKHP